MESFLAKSSDKKQVLNGALGSSVKSLNVDPDDFFISLSLSLCVSFCLQETLKFFNETKKYFLSCLNVKKKFSSVSDILSFLLKNFNKK